MRGLPKRIMEYAQARPEEVEDGLEAVLPTLRNEDRDELSAAGATMPNWMSQPVSAHLSHG